jgi:hypothetical protein
MKNTFSLFFMWNINPSYEPGIVHDKKCAALRSRPRVHAIANPTLAALVHLKATGRAL